MVRAKLDSLQVLRFVATILVVIAHSQHATVPQLGDDLSRFSFRLFDWGLGVDIFFVISGFVIYYLTNDRFAMPGVTRDFVTRRAIRVVPLYWVFTSIVLAVAMAEGMGVLTPNLVFSYLFLPGPRCADYCFPFYSLGWTLNYEIMFYLIFAVGLTQVRRTGLSFIVAAILTLIVVGQLVPARWTMLRFWGHPIIGEFLFGIAISWLYVGGKRLPAAVGWLMVASGFLLATLFYHSGAYFFLWRVVTGGIPGALIVTGAVLALEPSRETRWLAFLVAGGDASYALYLSHPIAIKATEGIASRLGLALMPPTLIVIIKILAAVAAGFLVHYFLEKPMIVRLRRRTTAEVATTTPRVLP